MEENIFTIVVKVGLQMKFEFDGTLLDHDKESNKFTFAEILEHYIPKKDGDMIVIDLNKRAIAFTTNHFTMGMDIMGHKKVGNNYHFQCATDLCHVDVFICEKALWAEKKESIFF